MKHRHLPVTRRPRRVTGPHPWRARLRAVLDGQPPTPNADARKTPHPESHPS